MEERTKTKEESVVNCSKAAQSIHTLRESERMCVCLWGRMNYDGYLSFIRLTFYNGCWEKYGKKLLRASTVISQVCFIHFVYSCLAVELLLLFGFWIILYISIWWSGMARNGMESKVEFFDISNTLNVCTLVRCVFSNITGPHNCAGTKEFWPR